MNPLSQLVADICKACAPLQIIQYSEKRTLSTSKLKALSLCVIVEDGEPRDVRRRLHLALSTEVPVTFSVYTRAQWQSLLGDETSYAAWISRKGQVLYEQKT